MAEVGSNKHEQQKEAIRSTPAGHIKTDLALSLLQMMNNPDFFLLHEKQHPEIDYLTTRVYHDRKSTHHDDWGVHVYLPSDQIPKNNLEMEHNVPEIHQAINLAEEKLYNHVILHDKVGQYADFPAIKEPTKEKLNKSEVLNKADMPPKMPPQIEAISTAPNVQQYMPESLKHLAVMESADHTQRIHPVVKAGIHKDTRAVSSYGLMPKYIQEVAKKYTPLANSEWGAQILKAAHPQEVSEITANRKADDGIAAHIWNYNQSRISHNFPNMNISDKELVTVLAHRRGINSALQTYKINGIEGVKKDPYVQKYLSLKSEAKE